MPKQNLHTHTLWCDGKDSVDAMVKKAIDLGFDSLGFSGHGQNRTYDPWSMDEKALEGYLADIKKARADYAGQMEIFTGIEQDSMGTTYRKEDGFDYIIGSVHFVEKNGTAWPVDFSPSLTRAIVELIYDNDFLAYAKDYYAEVTRLQADLDVDIVGHLDLLMKFNEDQSYLDFENPAYLDLAEAAIEALVQANKIFEINTGAISRGYRSQPYPHLTLLKKIREVGGKICITTDCHNKDHLDTGMALALEAARQAGFESLMVLTKAGFVPVSLEAFAI